MSRSTNARGSSDANAKRDVTRTGKTGATEQKSVNLSEGAVPVTEMSRQKLGELSRVGPNQGINLVCQGQKSYTGTVYSYCPEFDLLILRGARPAGGSKESTFTMINTKTVVDFTSMTKEQSNKAGLWEEDVEPTAFPSEGLDKIRAAAIKTEATRIERLGVGVTPLGQSIFDAIVKT